VRVALGLLLVAALFLSVQCGGACSGFIENVPRVTVLDKTSMLPICDATVIASTAAGSFALTALTNPDGSCVYSSSGDTPRQGDVQVEVSRTGFQTRTVDTTIQTDSCGHPHDDVTVLLEPQ
jgi:hypothetical protein